jgi:hypothetical protein
MAAINVVTTSFPVVLARFRQYILDYMALPELMFLTSLRQLKCSNFLDSIESPRYTSYCSQLAVKDASARYRRNLTYNMAYRERKWVIS